MIYVRINDSLYPASISGKINDRDWDGRESKSITINMDYNTAVALFVDGAQWSIVQEEEITVEEPVYQVDENNNFVLDEDSNLIQIDVQLTTQLQTDEFDNSDFVLAGDITDHRDGTITAKMGKLTELEEAYIMILGGM